MIPLQKLARLHPRHRLRKAALVLTETERLMRSPDPVESGSAADYALNLARFLTVSEETPPSIRERAMRAVTASEASFPISASASAVPANHASPRGFLRAIDELRHALIRETGQSPADWDLLDPVSGRPDAASRLVHPGMRAYLEDLRSPFNVGSMLRSADAFGLEEMLLSEDSADPDHPRAVRSSMGAGGLVPWRRAGIGALAGEDGVFALELGGVPLDEFVFPERGIVVVGSEELGVSPEALELCGLGRVSIPMAGAKGSLNAGVAFGVLLYAWTRSLERRSRPPLGV